MAQNGLLCADVPLRNYSLTRASRRVPLRNYSLTRASRRVSVWSDVHWRSVSFFIWCFIQWHVITEDSTVNARCSELMDEPDMSCHTCCSHVCVSVWSDVIDTRSVSSSHVSSSDVLKCEQTEDSRVNARHSELLNFTLFIPTLVATNVSHPCHVGMLY